MPSWCAMSCGPCPIPRPRCGTGPVCSPPVAALVLVEGRWGEADPIGLPGDELAALVEPLAARTRVESLAHDPALWGKEVADERYVLIADLPRRHTEVVDVHGAVRRGGEDAVAHDPSGPGRAVVLDGPGPTG